MRSFRDSQRTLAVRQRISVAAGLPIEDTKVVERYHALTTVRRQSLKDRQSIFLVLLCLRVPVSSLLQISQEGVESGRRSHQLQRPFSAAVWPCRDRPFREAQRPR